MQGFDPVTEKPIRPAGSDGTRVAGIDLSYAPPKEVSALWATTDPYRRAQIEVAHRKAVKSTLKRIEREVALRAPQDDKGVSALRRPKVCSRTEVVHTTSRLGKDQDEHGIPDPQLHSHIVLLAAERKDGVIAAIESKQLYPSGPRERRVVPRELAANLQELGIGIERHQGNGERYFGVRGVSKDLSERWSTRAQDVAPCRQPLPPALRPRARPRRARRAHPLHPRVEDRRVTGGGQRRVARARRGAQPDPQALRGSVPRLGPAQRPQHRPRQGAARERHQGIVDDQHPRTPGQGL